MRAVYPDMEDWPRYIGYDRGPTFYPTPGQNLSVPLGHIPQVNHTFAYYEACYGLFNERGLAIAESSCSSKIGAIPRQPGADHGALFRLDGMFDGVSDGTLDGMFAGMFDGTLD